MRAALRCALSECPGGREGHWQGWGGRGLQVGREIYQQSFVG